MAVVQLRAAFPAAGCVEDEDGNTGVGIEDEKP
jgi:hypothetical protein